MKTKWCLNLGNLDNSDDESFDGENDHVELDLHTATASRHSVKSALNISDNILTEISLMNENFLPSHTIVNPDDGDHGAFAFSSSLSMLEFLQAQRVDRENKECGNAGFTVKWDQNPASVIATLEGCGAAPTLLDGRNTDTERKPFDPKAPHFDIIVINLLNSPYFPQYTTVPEDGLPPTPMDNLPIPSLLGRPGFILLHVGGTSVGREEGLRLFEVWNVKALETVTWAAKNLTKLHPNQPGSKLLRPSCEHWLLGLKGHVNRSADSHLVHCNITSDVMVSMERPTIERLAENFSNGQRRLCLFAPSGAPRPGWVQMGKDLTNNFDCREWLSRWEAKGSWLLKKCEDIERLRPKSPADSATGGYESEFSCDGEGGDGVVAVIRRIESGEIQSSTLARTPDPLHPLVEPMRNGQWNGTTVAPSPVVPLMARSELNGRSPVSEGDTDQPIVGNHGNPEDWNLATILPDTLAETAGYRPARVVDLSLYRRCVSGELMLSWIEE